MSFDPYVPLQSFAEPARQRPQLWRVIATLALGMVAFVILTKTAISVLGAAAGPLVAQAILYAMQEGRTPLGVVAVLAGFLPLALGLALAVRVLHDRSWTSLLGPRALFLPTLFWVALGVLGLTAVLLPVQVMSDNVGRHLTLAQQLPWLPLALPALLLQSATEEALFRGYLTQQLAVLSRRQVVWMLVPSVLFALLHLDLSSSLPRQLWTGGVALVFALAASDLTARTGSLGPAIGLHLGSNIGGVLMLGVYGRMDGLAAWNLVLNPMLPWQALPYMAIDLLALAAAWLLARVLLRV